MVGGGGGRTYTKTGCCAGVASRHLTQGLGTDNERDNKNVLKQIFALALDPPLSTVDLYGIFIFLLAENSM